MVLISYKAKQFLVFLVKLLIVIGALYFIYKQLANNNALQWQEFYVLVTTNWTFATVFLLLLFSFTNRFLEILKWKNLVLVVKKIAIQEASKQVLAALTAGIFTPNGVGEYAGKALYFDKNQTKTIVFLNLVCNGVQMILTVFFGVLGLFYLGYFLYGVYVLFALVLLFIVLFFTKKITIKGYSLNKLVFKIKEIPKQIHNKNTMLAMGRYLVFSHQYYFLFTVFGVQNISYLDLMATISVVYFLASCLPSFQFLDFAVKGSVGVYFFGKLDINEWIVVFVSTLMWFLNVVLPVFIGSYFVLSFKVNHNSKFKS